MLVLLTVQQNPPGQPPDYKVVAQLRQALSQVCDALFELFTVQTCATE